MDTREWALILFTILIQMAVGSFLVLGIVHFFAIRKAGMDEADRLSDRALLAIGPTLVLGMIAALFHLGSPLSATRAVVNLLTSWLSREILFTVLFGIFGAAFAFMQWRKIGTFAVRNVVAWITALFGLALLFSMSLVYMLESQPAWNTIATPILFFTTSLLLGGLAIGAALAINYAYVRRIEPSCEEVQCTLLQDAVRGIAVGGIILLGIEMIVLPLQLSYLAASNSSATITSAGMLFSEYGILFALRLILVFIGAGIFGVLLYRIAFTTGREQNMANLLYVAFVLVLASEVMGRYLFYATHVQVGV